jgi:hypothetical protein
LSGLSFAAAVMDFDLIRATEQILGDFSSLSLIGLPASHTASAGIFDVAGVDVYRLSLAPVPEPATWAPAHSVDLA